MNLQIGFLALFSVLGLIVSATCGFLAGNYLSHILFISFLSTVGMAGFGFGVYSILEMKVPEFLEFLGSVTGGYSSSSDGEDGETGRGSYSDHSDLETSGPPGFDSPPSAGEMRAAASGIPRKKADKFGDHIIVENVAIKNEPKLMAEAIRTMLARDDGSTEK